MTEQAPPQIPGHRFVELIDEGGFAQVYKYVRESLGKEVAIKVLRSSAVGDLSQEDFLTEARIMAKLSGHPNIVTIHDHGTLDGERPYLIMEYCPPPNLKDRSKRERLAVTLVLEVAILVAGAVETAHRAGVYHRDIKPANILMDGYGPKLTDFGISEMLTGNTRAAEGVSIPWAPLEALQGTGFDARSDVYSLAATTYTLLTGRWPYEVPGDDNDWYALMERMKTGRPVPIGRDDVAPALERALVQALNPDPHRRPSTALDFAQSLSLAAPTGWSAPTPLVPEETARAAKEMTMDVGGWPSRQPRALRPPAPGRPPVGLVGGPAAPIHSYVPEAPAPDLSPDRSVMEFTTGLSGAGTVPRSRVAVHSGPADLDLTQARVRRSAEEPRSRRPVLVGAAACLALGVVTTLILFTHGDANSPDASDVQPTTPSVVAPPPPAAPAQARLIRSGRSVVFTWQSASDSEAGDEYRWQRVSAIGKSIGRAVPTGETQTTIEPVNPDQLVCAEVWVVRAGTIGKHAHTCVRARA